MFISDLTSASYLDRRIGVDQEFPISDPVAISWHLRRSATMDFSEEPDPVYWDNSMIPRVRDASAGGILWVRDPEISLELAALTPYAGENYVYDSISEYDEPYREAPRLYASYTGWNQVNKKITFKPVFFCVDPGGGSDAEVQSIVQDDPSLYPIPFLIALRSVGIATWDPDTQYDEHLIPPQFGNHVIFETV